MLLAVKYAPKKLGEIIGNSDKIEVIKQWLLQWLSAKARKPLLIYGPPGVGKSSVAYALKQEFDLDLIEMNASELRNKNRVERVLGQSTLAGSLFGRGKIVLIDDADILAGRKDSGGSTAIKNFLSDANCPAIVTASNVWDKSFAPIRAECELVEFKKINKLSIKKQIDHIAKLEKLPVSAEIITAIAEGANGDLRAALNDLTALGPTNRVHEKDIFQIVRGIFKAQTYAEAREAISGDIDYDLIKLWVDQNIPAEYEDKNEVAAAYNSLSLADVFDGRIRKTNWQFLKYSIDLATSGVALAKSKPYHKFTKYNFPSWLKDMSRSMERRAMLKAVGSKIGSRVHASRKDAIGYLPLLKEFGKTHPKELMDFYEFSEEELAFVLETSVSKLKS